MVRHYQKKVGGRTYRNYTDATIEEALQKIVDEQWSIRRAADTYKISFGTLYNRYNGLHIRSVGRPTLFSNEEELQFIESAAICGEWGFPLSKADIQALAKSCLDQKGAIISWLKENKPGIDWVDQLLLRHKSAVVKRVAANIKRARATVSETSLKEYFKNIEKTIKGVPPANCFNYDETNFSNDPGRSFKIYRRGVKYPEQICNYSKSATTVMMCGSASGVLLPPYIVYRAEKMWNTWTENGPKGFPCCNQRCCSAGARYNRTRHGWMEAVTFRDWFMNSFLPHAKTLQGKRVLIGDNLAAHFSDDVLKACEQNNIDFVCLVPKSTHLTQPLDVCFFRPMKNAWRSTLKKWKDKNPRISSLPKEEFPRLLQSSLLAMDNPESAKEPGAISRDLISGFAATGIVPFNPERVLCKIPGFQPEAPTKQINENLISFLKRQRFDKDDTTPNRQKRKMLKVVPGVSVVHVSAENDELIDQESRSPSPETTEEIEEEQGCSSQNQEIEDNSTQDVTAKVGDFVIVNMSVEGSNLSKKFVGCVTEVDSSNDLVIRFMRERVGKKTNFFVFPDVPDESIIQTTEVIAVIKPFSSRRGSYFFNNIDLN